jgi:hypothetical protein
VQGTLSWQNLRCGLNFDKIRSGNSHEFKSLVLRLNILLLIGVMLMSMGMLKCAVRKNYVLKREKVQSLKKLTGRNATYLHPERLRKRRML